MTAFFLFICKLWVFLFDGYEYFSALISQVDMAALVHMGDDDLKAMGIPMVIISY